MSSNGGDSSSPLKKNVGRRKLPMSMIQRESNRQVTFSKRRSGVFKKANELCTLTGSEAAVVVFSPANKVYSYGHPNVHDVTNRFANYHPGWNVGTDPENPEVKELLRELARKESELEATKARRRELQKEWDQMAKENKLVTPSVIEKMSYEELKKLKESMLMLKSDIQARMIEKQRAEAAAAGGGDGQSSNAIPYKSDKNDGAGEVIDGEGDDGEITDGSEDSVVELLEDGVGRRFF